MKITASSLAGVAPSQPRPHRLYDGRREPRPRSRIPPRQPRHRPVAVIFCSRQHRHRRRRPRRRRPPPASPNVTDPWAVVSGLLRRHRVRQLPAGVGAARLRRHHRPDLPAVRGRLRLHRLAGPERAERVRQPGHLQPQLRPTPATGRSSTSPGPTPSRTARSSPPTCTRTDGSRSEPLDDRHVGLAAALAHGEQSVPAAGALQRRSSVVISRAPVAPSGWPSAMAPPQTLTWSRSAPVSRCHASTTLANASLISTRSISADRQPGPLQRVRGRGDRRGQHQDRIVAAGAEVVDPGARRQPCAARAASLDDQQRRRGVGDLAGQGGGDPAAVAQRLQARIRSSGCRGAGTRPPRHRRRRRSRRRSSLVDGPTRPPVTRQRELLHLRPADAPLLGDQIGAAELGDLLAAVPRSPAGRAAERIRRTRIAGPPAWPRRSGSGSCSARRRRRRRRPYRSAQPARRNERPAGMSRTAGRR